MKRNGRTPVRIKTIHGSCEFAEQRFLRGEGSEVRYFELTGQCLAEYVSPRLQELSAYYSNRMRYEEVAGLLERTSGERVLSDQKIWEMVLAKATAIRIQLKTAVETTVKNRQMPVVNASVDLYDAACREVVLLADAIGVKEQKAQRGRRRDEPAEGPQPQAAGGWVYTDGMMVEQASGEFRHLVAGMDQQGQEVVSLTEVVRANLSQEYGTAAEAPTTESQPIKVVVLGDGARAIRHQVLAIFGVLVTMILDWYHLKKKVGEFLSMIARNKAEKQAHRQRLLTELWQGRVGAAQDYLRTEVTARNEEKRQELLGYLEKHAHEIIDYGRRQQAGKRIGSGRIEKGVDQVIGQRQKKKGMSWSTKGSKALAILKVVELNQEWEQLWFPERMAA